MKLKEYQAKKLFRRFGIPTPNGKLVRSPEEAGRVARELQGAVVIKPQLNVKGRGKVGGIGFADSVEGTVIEAERLLNTTILSEKVELLLVEKKIEISQEIYVAVTVDYDVRRPLIIASDRGGIDIEQIAVETPERLIRIHISLLKELSDSDLSPVQSMLGYDVSDIVKKLYTIFIENDAEMVEINPIVRNTAGNLCAVDAVLNVNDDAIYRHELLKPIQEEILREDPISAEAQENNWTYIDLPGTIGILSSGAGLTMAILDLIQAAGGQAANFLDTAQFDDEGIYKAFDLLLRAKPVKVLFVNIFAGLNRCDLLARGICRYIEDHRPDVPLVVRMVGNAEKEGHRILKDIGITPYSSLEKAISSAVDLGGKH